MLSKKKVPNLNIAILGANGIGRVHARIFHSLGIDIKVITCSSDKSASQAAKFLLDSYGIRTKAFSNINEAISEPIDAVSICTPSHLHYENILAAFDKKLPVFCEKPLFWEPICDYDKGIRKLNKLKNHSNRNLFLNTSNSLLIKYIMSELFYENNISYFLFKFYTKGNNINFDIAVDLLPHGMAIIQSVFGEHELSKFLYDSDKNRFRCKFQYNGCDVEFDFKEYPECEKLFVLQINDRIFKRVQSGTGKEYKVYINDEQNNRVVRVPDPFEVYISEFIRSCNSQSSKINDDFNSAYFNQKTILKCLKKKISNF